MRLKRWPTPVPAVVGLAFAGIVAVSIVWWLLWHNPFIEKMDWQGYGALWSAAATLVTGLAAVGGAVFVGARQTEIQAKQVALQEQELRLELLARRADAIKELVDFYRAYVPSAGPLSPEVRFEIYDSLTRACLIFPENIGNLFQKCLDSLNVYSRQRGNADELHCSGSFEEARKQGAAAREVLKGMMGDFDALLKAMTTHARVEL